MASSGKTRALIALVMAAGVAAAGYTLYSRPASPPAAAAKPRAAVPVTVTTATAGEFQVRDHTIGTVSIDATVQVKSRVDGQVIAAAFRLVKELPVYKSGMERSAALEANVASGTHDASKTNPVWTGIVRKVRTSTEEAFSEQSSLLGDVEE